MYTKSKFCAILNAVSRNKRRFPRISTDFSARAVLQQVYPPIDIDTEVKVYQLSASGCGIECVEKFFRRGDGLYLKISLGEAKPLLLCCAVIWVSRGDEKPFRCGLKFLWIRKEPGEEMDDPVTEKLNEMLRTTGVPLLPKA